MSSSQIPELEDRRSAGRYPCRLPLTVIVPSDRVGTTRFGSSDYFDVVQGRTLDLSEDGIGFVTAVPVHGSTLLLELNWPDAGRVMLRAELLRSDRVDSDGYIHAARIHGVVTELEQDDDS